MPGFDQTPNQIRFRVRDPKEFTRLRVMSMPGNDDIQLVVGRMRGEKNTKVQSIHFKRKTKDHSGFTMDQARKWVADHPDTVKESIVHDDFEDTDIKVSINDPALSQHDFDGESTMFMESRFEATFLEADAAGMVWDVAVISAGVSKNGRNYSHEVLQQAASKFTDAQVRIFVRREDLQGNPVFDHMSMSEVEAVPGGFLRNVVGVLKDAKFEGGRILARLHLHDNAKKLGQLLKSMFAKGVLEKHVGLSIDAQGEQLPSGDVAAIHSVHGVDLVTNPAAGGGFERMVASYGDTHTGGLPVEKLKQLIENFVAAVTAASPNEAAIKEACTALKAHDLSKITDSEFDGLVEGMHQVLMALGDKECAHLAGDSTACMQFVKNAVRAAKVRAKESEIATQARTAQAAEDDAKSKQAEDARTAEAAKGHAAATATAPEPGPQIKKMIESEVETKLTRYTEGLAMGALLERRLGESGLPDKSREAVRQYLEGRTFNEGEIGKAIGFQRELTAEVLSHYGVGNPQIAGGGNIGLLESDEEKTLVALDGFFFSEDQKTPKGSKIARFKSFREAYVAVTGDQKVTGRRSGVPRALQGLERRMCEASTQRMTEALASTDWTQVLGDSIARRMIAEYSLVELQQWRKIVSSVVPLNDFRTQRRMRIGGYGNLSSVAEAGAYGALTSPTDEEATYSPSKYGGLETITFEMIRNDDVGAIRQIPVRLGRAAGNTLHTELFGIFPTNANVTYTGADALFSAAHANTGTTALSAAALNTAMTTMADLTRYNASTEFLPNDPKFLLVPNELRKTANILTRSVLEPGGGNNDINILLDLDIEVIVVKRWTDANNWYLVADPRNIATIEVGFLDGKEEPELFVQDSPVADSFFTNDQIRYKIRHIWGWTVLDHRGMFGAIVT